MSVDTNLLELRLERLKRLGNLRLEYLQRIYDWRSVGERYVMGACNVHVHIRRPNGVAVCFVYRWRLSSTTPVIEGPGFQESREMPVFVWIREGAKEFRPVASFVRLQALDACYMGIVDTLQERVTVTRKILWCVVDRELRSILGVPGVQPGEGIDEIVEGGAEIVDRFPNQDARSWFDQLDADNVRGCSGDELTLDGSIRIVLPQGIEEGTQLRKMFLCPPDPRPHPAEQAEGHG